jgi:uncharacterized protein YbjQ (UPF0145 family)
MLVFVSYPKPTLLAFAARMFAIEQGARKAMLLVTTDTVPGQVIEQVHGLVVGKAGAFSYAQDQLAKEAMSKGANAVVGVRYNGDRHVFAYGTAVVVRPA